jgi:hypothetical protein
VEEAKKRDEVSSKFISIAVSVGHMCIQ